MDITMIPITKPSLDNSDYRYIKQVLKSKILTDGYFQQKTEKLLIAVAVKYKKVRLIDNIIVSLN